jgi:hypothetical protein
MRKMKKGGKISRTIKPGRDPELPDICDFSCRHAEFAGPESVGACRKDIAVYCRLHKKYNNKNTSCISKK